MAQRGAGGGEQRLPVSIH